MVQRPSIDREGAADGFADQEKRDLIAWHHREIAGATGHLYRIAFEGIDLQTLRALLRDLETERAIAARRGQARPWALAGI